MTEHDDRPKREQPSVAPEPHPPSEQADSAVSRSGASDVDGAAIESPGIQSGAAAADEPVELGGEPAQSIRELLRGAMGQDEPAVPDMLRGVQRKIRARSGGKFFADGWSTTRQPPISTFLVTSLFMLAILVLVYLVLSPLAGAPIENTVPAGADTMVPPNGP